jgi:hypothetical protein
MLVIGRKKHLRPNDDLSACIFRGNYEAQPCIIINWISAIKRRLWWRRLGQYTAGGTGASPHHADPNGPSPNNASSGYAGSHDASPGHASPGHACADDTCANDTGRGSLS